MPPITPLPDDAILLHIGVHKTGTTALQTSLHAARADLAAHGVTYPGTEHAHHIPVTALVDSVWGWGVRDPAKSEATWARFAAEVSAMPGRVLLSSEFFCQANDEQAARAVESLGADRIHVLIGLRPLAALLPSSWQQYLKTGRSTTYEKWLQHVLADPPGNTLTPSFWKRNDIPAVLNRWSSLVGADRMTAVVVDESDRSRLANTVTSLLGVPADVVGAPVDLRSNRSMTAEEAELLREVNVVARQQLTSPVYAALIRNGAAVRMVESRRPTESEHRLGLPEWAVPRVSELAAAHVLALSGSGVTVVGDPTVLAAAPRTAEIVEVDAVPIDAAAEALLGALLATDTVFVSKMRDFRTRELAREILRRVARATRRLPASLGESRR